MQRIVFMPRKLVETEEQKSSLIEHLMNCKLGSQHWDSSVIDEYEKNRIKGMITIIRKTVGKETEVEPRKIANMVIELNEQGLPVAFDPSLNSTYLKAVRNNLEMRTGLEYIEIRYDR